jgi:hypothetical protein
MRGRLRGIFVGAMMVVLAVLGVATLGTENADALANEYWYASEDNRVIVYIDDANNWAWGSDKANVKVWLYDEWLDNYFTVKGGDDTTNDVKWSDNAGADKVSDIVELGLNDSGEKDDSEMNTYHRISNGRYDKSKSDYYTSNGDDYNGGKDYNEGKNNLGWPNGFETPGDTDYVWPTYRDIILYNKGTAAQYAGYDSYTGDLINDIKGYAADTEMIKCTETHSISGNKTHRYIKIEMFKSDGSSVYDYRYDAGYISYSTSKKKWTTGRPNFTCGKISTAVVAIIPEFSGAGIETIPHSGTTSDTWVDATITKAGGAGRDVLRPYEDVTEVAGNKGQYTVKAKLMNIDGGAPKSAGYEVKKGEWLLVPQDTLNVEGKLTNFTDTSSVEANGEIIYTVTFMARDDYDKNHTLTISLELCPVDYVVATDCTRFTGSRVGTSSAGGDGSGTQTDVPNNTDVWSQCAVGSFSWVLCPLLETGSGIVDWAYGWIEGQLQVDTDLYSETSGTNKAWIIFRNMANVVFIILMLVAIISQLTGYGLSNYNIKRILPRLIVVAIMLNLSYFVCQIAVDLSNILGAQLHNLLSGIDIGGAAVPIGTSAPEVIGGIGLGILAIVAVGALIWFNIGVILLALVGALLAVLLLVIILMIRKVAIILLIAIAPVAFVCLLLPNTEGLFKKWVNIFKALLIVYPICGLLMGAGALASKIVITSSPNDDLMHVIGAAMAVVPFFAVISLTKGSLNALGSMGAKITGALGGAAGALDGKMRGSRTGQLALNRDKLLQNNRRNAVLSGEKKTLAAKALGGISRGKYSGSSLTGSLAGSKFGQFMGASSAYTRMQNRATREVDKQYGEDLKGSVAQLKKDRIGDDISAGSVTESFIKSALADAEKGDTIQLEGALQAMMERGKEEEAFTVLNNAMGTGNVSRKQAETLTSMISGNKSLSGNALFGLMNKSYSKDLGMNPAATSFSSLSNKINGVTPAGSGSAASNNFGSLMHDLDTQQLGSIIGNKDNAKALNTILQSTGTDNRDTFINTISADGSKLGGAIAAAKNGDAARASLNLLTSDGTHINRLDDAVSKSGAQDVLGWSADLLSAIGGGTFAGGAPVASRGSLSHLDAGVARDIMADTTVYGNLTDTNLRNAISTKVGAAPLPPTPRSTEVHKDSSGAVTGITEHY